MSRKFILISKTFDKRKRQISMGQNSYSKTSPVMKSIGERIGVPFKEYLHAETLALLRCKDKVPYLLTVERYDTEGNMKLSKPCAICEEAMRIWGVSIVRYTTDNGWVEERLK